jgi:hypothetical protein
MAGGYDSAQSFFGWLDYDELEAQRMREIFAAFDDKDTIDSLGLGVIRDSISDQLFPGISTVQTRARYFLFVPWVCQILEAEQVPAGRFAARLRELEVALIESLRQMEGANQGVIGYRARKGLTRLPSSIYWNGLGTFGIRRLDLSTAEYRSFVARYGRVRAAVTLDDDGEPVAGQPRMWDPALPDAPRGFPEQPISLRLSREEAEYLAGRFITTRPESMIGELARDLTIDRSAPVPWEVPLTDAAPRLREVLGHARNFSELMEGAQALYNLLLARRAEQLLGHDYGDLIEQLVGELDDWAQLVAARQAELSAWIASDGFWFVIERAARVPGPTQRFVLRWADVALARPDLISKDPAAALLITEREQRLKVKLARLTEQRALENWNGEPFGVGQMTFRWANARQILDDLRDHEER